MNFGITLYKRVIFCLTSGFISPCQCCYYYEIHDFKGTGRPEIQKVVPVRPVRKYYHGNEREFQSVRFSRCEAPPSAFSKLVKIRSGVLRANDAAAFDSFMTVKSMSSFVLFVFINRCCKSKLNHNLIKHIFAIHVKFK